jgi:hypothetical protein
VNISVQTMAIERIQLDKFLRQDGGHLPVPMSLILFTDTATRMQPSSTRDGNALATLLDANETGLRPLDGRRDSGAQLSARICQCAPSISWPKSRRPNQAGNW